MTQKLYTVRLSFDVLVEATDAATADKALNNWLDELGDVPTPDGVLSWDNVDWTDPEELPEDER
jgi:hypothetical protein